MNSRTSLIPSTAKAESQAFLQDRRNYAPPRNPHFERPVLGFARNHVPQPINLSDLSGGKAMRPVFNYTVTTPRSSMTSMSQSSDMKYTSIRHPYATDSPSSSGFYSRPSTPLSSRSSSTAHDSRIGIAISPSPVPFMRSVSERTRTALTRSRTAQSAAPSYVSRPFPNPFESRSSTPSTPSTVASVVPSGPPNVSLSFGSRGFPIPPQYNATGWSPYTDEHLRSYTPPSTPRSLIPGVPIAKRSLPSLVSPRSPMSFGSVTPSLHSITLPSPPTVARSPTPHLPPHPGLETHLVLAPFQGSSLGLKESDTVISPAAGTPTTAKTFRSQRLPTDIPDWELGNHEPV